MKLSVAALQLYAAASASADSRLAKRVSIRFHKRGCIARSYA